MAGYDELRREQAEKREPRRADGHRHRRSSPRPSAPARASTWTSSGLGMNDGADLRVHPTGKARLGHQRARRRARATRRRSRRSSPRSSGIPPEDIEVVHGDTDLTPYGLGTYGSPLHTGHRRRRPRSWRARCASKARIVAAAMLEVSPDDLEWEKGRWFVKGDPEQGATIQEIAMGAHGTVELPDGSRRRPRRRDRLRPAEPDLPVRRLHLRRRHRPGHGRRQGAAVHRRRRLRHADQPDDHRGPDPRRAHRRGRDGADGADRVRRGRQLPGRLADGLPDPDRDGGARLGDRTTPSPPRRTTRSAPRASASRRPSARRRRSSTRSSTR